MRKCGDGAAEWSGKKVREAWIPALSQPRPPASSPPPKPGMMSAFIDFVKAFSMLLPMCLQDSKSWPVHDRGYGAKYRRKRQDDGSEEHFGHSQQQLCSFRPHFQHFMHLCFHLRHGRIYSRRFSIWLHTFFVGLEIPTPPYPSLKQEQAASLPISSHVVDSGWGINTAGVGIHHSVWDLVVTDYIVICTALVYGCRVLQLCKAWRSIPSANPSIFNSTPPD